MVRFWAMPGSAEVAAGEVHVRPLLFYRDRTLHVEALVLRLYMQMSSSPRQLKEPQ
jgi:hypothetical protein